MEAGYFISRVSRECNNLLGLLWNDGSYYRFVNWVENVMDYKDYGLF